MGTKLKIHKLQHLPNIEGFKFHSILKDGTRVLDEVKRNPITHLHYTTHFKDSIGWVRL